MIKYALRCNNGHGFEAWFRSSDAYDRQAKRRLVDCPSCGSVEVEKQPMAPALKKSRSSPPPEAQRNVPPGTQMPTLEMLRAFKRHVLENSEDVGPKFAEEARKIHYGDSEARAIRGEASAHEAVELKEEGIEFGILPVVPDDLN